MGGKSTLRTRQKGKKAPTVAKLKKTAWKLLSEVIRREATLNLHPPEAGISFQSGCYTCGEYHPWKEQQAGHAIGGRTGMVLLDEDLIRVQCPRCNIFLRGNYPVFTTKLIKEKGMEWWEAKLQASRQIKKWTRSELQEKIESYKARIEALGV